MITLSVRCTSYETTRRMVVWVKFKCQKSWLVSSLMETRKFGITNRWNKKYSQLKEFRSVDEEMPTADFPSKLKCFNKLSSPSEAHRWLRHLTSFDFFASHWVTKTIYLVAPLRLAVFATSTCNRQVKKHARMKAMVISVSLLQSHLTLIGLLAPLIARKFCFWTKEMM